MKTTIIDAFDIPDAWFKVISACMKQETYERPVFRGERKEERRKELDILFLNIKHPEIRPLCPQINIPNFPQVSSDSAIDNYLAYIATPDKADGQDYTYGERTHGTMNINSEVLKFMEDHDKQEGKNIHSNCNQFEVITNFLKETPETNRATVEVGMAQDLFLKHPPCLRYMQLKVRDNKLHLFLVFRSWDAMYGLPMNLGAYQKLVESVVIELNEEYEKTGKPLIESGEMFATSFGCHVYSGQWKLALEVINRSAGRVNL